MQHHEAAFGIPAVKSCRVCVRGASGHHVLLRSQSLQGSDPVAFFRRQFKAEVLSVLFHLGRQAVYDLGCPSLQHQYCLGDCFPVLFSGGFRPAVSPACVHMIVEAGPRPADVFRELFPAGREPECLGYRVYHITGHVPPAVRSEVSCAVVGRLGHD